MDPVLTFRKRGCLATTRSPTRRGAGIVAADSGSAGCVKSSDLTASTEAFGASLFSPRAEAAGGPSLAFAVVDAWTIIVSHSARTDRRQRSSLTRSCRRNGRLSRRGFPNARRIVVRSFFEKGPASANPRCSRKGPYPSRVTNHGRSMDE